ncbi:MAG: 1,4-dihydroxy-2-naphthoate octaprenyltransferase [Promethearchaeota archaeon]
MAEADDESSATNPPSRLTKRQAFIAELRVPFLTASIIPVLLGASIAWGRYQIFAWDLFVWTLIAGVCVHLGANISNDYFDHTYEATGTDDINVEYIRPFSGGSRMIQLGYLTAKEVLAEAMFFFAVAVAIGLYLAWVRGIVILVIGLIGVGSAFFYTAPPFHFVKRGIGEIFIGLNFGVLMVFGAFYVQAPNIELEPIVASLPVALLITAVLYINQFPDYKADRDSGKRTLVVRLGRAAAAKGYVVLMASVFSIIGGSVVLNLIAWEAIIGLAVLPIAVVGAFFALKHYDEPLKMIPANAATIQSHMLTGIFMTVGYLLLAFSVGWFEVLVAFTIAIGGSSVLANKLRTPPKGMEPQTYSP